MPLAGEIIDVENFQAEIAALQTEIDNLNGPWESYTPAWGATGSAPSIGDGILDGRYLKMPYLCFVQMRLRIGASTGLGTGSYMLQLPFVTSGGISPQLFTGLLELSGGGPAWASFTGRVPTASNLVQFFRGDETTVSLDGTFNGGLVAGDELIVTGFYQPGV